MTSTIPLLNLVKALGAELYIDGVRVCPDCKEDWGSKWCTCGPADVAELLATAPQDLPPIFLDLRDGAR